MKPHEKISADDLEEIAAPWLKTKKSKLFKSDVMQIDFHCFDRFSKHELSTKTGQEAIKQELLRTKGDVPACKTLYVSWLKNFVLKFL